MSLLTDIVPHGRTIMYMVTPATDASMMAVGHFSKIFDPGENGLQLNYDSVTRLKNESAANRKTFRSAFTRNVFITRHGCDTRHTRRWAECKIDHTLCKGDLAFFCNCPTTLEKCVSRHMSALHVSHDMWMIWKQSNSPTFLALSPRINT